MTLVMVHVVTGSIYFYSSGLSWADVLVFERDLQFRVAMGGQYLSKIELGEWWRLLSSVFLHATALHVVINAVAILALARILEPWIGSFRFWLWFLIGGACGSVASQMFGVLQSDGASGGAYGLLGAAAIISLKYRHKVRRKDRAILGPLLWALLVLNLVVSALIPVVDMVGHVGGLVVGLGLGLVYRHRQPSVERQQLRR